MKLKLARKLSIGIFVVILGYLATTSVFAQQPEYKDTRLMIFHLLNLVPGSPAQNPSPNPQASPTPSVKQTTITYKGNVVGNGQYTTAGGYQMSVDIPERYDVNFDYYAFLRRTNPVDTVRLGDKLPGFRFQAADTRDLTEYSELLITEEQKGATPPTQPANIKYQGSQAQITPTAGPTSSQPTAQPTTAQPTTGQPSGQPSGSPSGNPQTTPGQQGPPIADQIRAVVDAVSESNIREYLTNIANEDGKTDQTQTRFSGTEGNLEEQNYMIQHFQNLGYEVDTTQSYSYRYRNQQITTKNIIARLPGRNISSFYLVVAHMDSTAERSSSTDPAPGVDDNGSGTVAVMEIARAIKAAQIQPEHSIEFVLFSGEEQGLHGSKNYVQALSQNKNIRGVVNLDMIGNIDPQGDCVNFNFKPGTGGNLISDAVMQVNTDFNIGLNGRSRESSMGRSDHASFWSAGINTAIFGHECKSGADGGVYHSLQDKIESVSMSQITKAAKAVGGALVKLSQEGIGQQVSNELNAMLIQQLATNISYDPRYMLIPNLANSFEERLAASNANTQNPNSGLGLVQQAQASNDFFILARVPFQDLTEIDILFENVGVSIEYLMGEEVPVPQFLGLFNEQQLSKLRDLGYEPVIIDENTDLRQYVYLFHPQPNQGFKIEEKGEVFEISPNYYLLKLAPGETHSHEGVLGEFFDMPLPQNISPPPFRTARITLAPTPTAGPSEVGTDVPEKQNEGISPALILFGAIFILLIMISVGLFFIVKRNNNSSNESHDQ